MLQWLLQKKRQEKEQEQKISWTKIESIEITYEYMIMRQDSSKSKEKYSATITSDEIMQGPDNQYNWRVKESKCAEIMNMISASEKKNPHNNHAISYFREVLWITAELSNDKFGNLKARLRGTFDTGTVGILFYANDLKEENLKNIHLWGTLSGNKFHLDSIMANNPQYLKCGLAHMMFLILGISIPFLENYSGTKLHKIYGTVNENGGDNPEKSIPFYRSLSGTILPFGERMVLMNDIDMGHIGLNYQIQK